MLTLLLRRILPRENRELPDGYRLQPYHVFAKVICD
jgi:hypothetical protein